MKRLLLCLVFISHVIVALSQKQTFDLVTYTPPAKWKKEVKENSISYTITNKKNNTWCRIGIIKSTASKGTIAADFESEWQQLVAKPYNTTDAPQVNEVQDTGEWKIQAGTGKFSFNNNEAIALLTTASGYNRCVSVVSLTNSKDYINDIQSLLASISLKKQDVAGQSPIYNADNNTGTGTQDQTEPSQATSNGFAFSLTNFDDGWTSTVQNDWVEVTKGSIKVLLHYSKAGTVLPGDPAPMTTAVWNILVAPRYSNLKNFKTAYVGDYNRPYFGMGYVTENKTGKPLFVVLFKRNSGWIEIASSDATTFTREFGFNPETIRWGSISQYLGGWVVTDSQGNTVKAEADIFNKLDNMAGKNKFAVAASDLKGKWTSDFTGISQLYNVYTGDYAGMQMNQSNEEFTFGSNNTYEWKFLAVNGMAGNAKLSQAKSSGTFSLLNNWQVKFSKIESRAKTCNAFWSCVKGARVLNLLDADSPGSGIYTKYGLAK